MEKIAQRIRRGILREKIYAILDGEATKGYLFNWEELGADLTIKQRMDYFHLIVEEILKVIDTDGTCYTR